MARQTKKDSDGNLSLDTLASRGTQALQFVRYCAKWSSTVGLEYHIRSVTLYPPSASRNGMWLVIAKGWYGGHKLVAFHRASDPLTAMLGMLQRYIEGKLDWKEDKYGDERGILPPSAK